MRTVFTVLTLAFVSFAFLSGAFAVSSGTGAIGFIQADQCDSTTFYGCAKVFFSNLGQPLPIINDASFLKLFEDYLLANNIAGLKNTCQWLATFDSCSSHNCWTAANFKSLGVQESDYFATVFKAAFNLCNSNDVKFLLQDGDQCLSSISALDQIQFLGCVSGLISGGISNIPNIPCSTLATTLSCLFKALKKTSSCSANVDAALCQTIVFAVDMLLPNCKLQLDPTCTSAAISSTATAKTAVSKELAAMKNVSTVLVLVLVSLTLLHGSFAVSSDAGAIGVIQADQCDPNKLRTCVTSLFAGFGQRVPPDTTILINLLTNYILSNGISALSNICQGLTILNNCISFNCWTQANFGAIGIQDNNYADVFMAAYNLCNSDGVQPLLQNGGQCLSQFSDGGQQLNNCVNGINNQNPSSTTCSTIASTLHCLVRALETTSNCPANADVALCQSIVSVGSPLLPQNCKSQLDIACTSAATPSISGYQIWTTAGITGLALTILLPLIA